jgi:hypothetical protein
MDEAYQRLLTLYYIRSGAAAVIPGAHTGEFAGNDLRLLSRWMQLVREMVTEYGNGKLLLMAAIGGTDVLQKAEAAAGCGYDIAMVAPTAFSGKSQAGVIRLLQELSDIIPLFGFELQHAIPGSYTFTPELWREIFGICIGAKGASFDTYRSIQMLEAAAGSGEPDKLIMLTGNDDRIVADLLGEFSFPVKQKTVTVRYDGGLLGHFATDTRAVRTWVDALLRLRQKRTWPLEMSQTELAHAVNCCNMVLFDALGNFENSVWGVKYRLTALGLLPSPQCLHESGRRGQAEAIDEVYSRYPELNDKSFVMENLEAMKREVGIRD